MLNVRNSCILNFLCHCILRVTKFEKKIVRFVAHLLVGYNVKGKIGPVKRAWISRAYSLRRSIVISLLPATCRRDLSSIYKLENVADSAVRWPCALYKLAYYFV